MVDAVGLAFVGAVVVLHTLFAAVATRFFRIRMETRWGALLYAAVVTPVVLVVATLLLGSVVSGSLDPAVLFGLWIGLPVLVGITVDVLYVPAPEEYELPDTRT